jgi:hypothetical protein
MPDAGPESNSESNKKIGTLFSPLLKRKKPNTQKVY